MTGDRWAGIPEPRDPAPEPVSLPGCPLCGALIVDPTVHTDWHRDELARVRAGLLRARRTAART